MVSVVVPVYKSEKTLERCVNSLLAQTYEQLEIILVIDGPTDGSCALAECLAKQDGRIRIINQENQGVSVSRNRGIQEAKGEYIRFVDSDDYVEPDSVACMVEAMESGVDLVIAGFHHLYFGRTVEKLPPVEGTFKPCESRDELLLLYRTGYLNMPWNKLYRREKIQEGFPVDLNLGEDLLFNMRYLGCSESYRVIRKAVCEYIQDDRGTTLSTKRRMDKIPIAFRLYGEVEKAFADILGKDNFANVTDVLGSKVMVEFLDDLEGLAFDKELSRKEKKQVICRYMEAGQELYQRNPQAEITLELLDYRIIYFFYKRKMVQMTYLMIVLRGITVKILGKR